VDAATGAVRHARAHRGRTVDRLITLIRFPTVSADPQHARDMGACANWLARTLRGIGLADVKVYRGRVAPVITGAWNGRPGRPTVLVYGHYDVQPAGPLSAWDSGPFQAVRVGPHLYGRGASDDKGQLMAHLAAIEAWLETTGGLPVNLRLVLDGEEEIGSPTLVSAVSRGWPPLTADMAVVSDTWMLRPGSPVLITGLRGAVRTRLELSGPATDLHAGAFGGAVADPAAALARLVAGLHDKTGRIAVAGFYDRVRAIAGKERDRLARSGPPDPVLLELAQVTAGHGEPGFSAFERATRRPAIVVTNLSSSGRGRAVVPARAAADLNMRLVADQEPAMVAQALQRHIRARMPPGVRGRLSVTAGCPPYTLDPYATVISAVNAACRRVYGRDAVQLPSGGSIPFVSTLAAVRGTDVALCGFGLPDDRIHSANERFYLPNLFRGTELCIELYRQLAMVRADPDGRVSRGRRTW
jgi:acetylornithine deacetylase/succinyl-diaminopimelate desuccinylase-like protein